MWGTMNRTGRNVLKMAVAAALSSALCLSLSSCFQPLSGGAVQGKASVDFGFRVTGLSASAVPSAAARTVWPGGNSSILTAAYYSVTGNGPDGQYINQNFSSSGSATLGSLLPGAWTFTARAFNSSGLQITGDASATATLQSGSNAALSFSLAPQWDSWGNGALSVSVYWGGTSFSAATSADPTPSTVTLTGIFGHAGVSSFSASHGEWVGTNQVSTPADLSLLPGVYRLDIVLNSQAGEPDVWGRSEIIYIGPGYTTYAYLSLSSADLRQGPSSAVSPSLNSGVVVSDADGSHPSSFSFYGINAGDRVYYTMDGTTPDCSSTGIPSGTSTPYYGGTVAINGTPSTTVSVNYLVWNPWGKSAVAGVAYSIQDAVYVDAAVATGGNGTHGAAYKTIQEGLNRILSCQRTAQTQLRVAIGSYTGPFYLYDGLNISGGWTDNGVAAWTQDISTPASAYSSITNNATVISSTAGPATLSLLGASTYGVSISYLSVEGSSDGWPALLLSNSDHTVALTHVQATGMGTNPTNFSAVKAISLKNNSNSSIPVLVLKDSYIIGPPSASPKDSYGLELSGTVALIAASTVMAGTTNSGATTAGISCSSNSDLTLKGASVVTGATGMAAASQSTGVFLNSSRLTAVGSTINSGAPDSSVGAAYGVYAFDGSSVDISGCAVSATGAAQTSYGIYGQNGLWSSNATDLASAAVPTADVLYVHGGSTVTAANDVAAQDRASAIYLESGYAVISGNALIRAGSAGSESSAISVAPVPSTGDWANVLIQGNQSISSGIASSSSGISLSGPIRAAILDNVGTASAPGISGGSNATSQSGLSCTDVSSLSTQYDGASLTVAGNWISGGFSSAGTSAAIKLSGTFPQRPILIARNRLWGGSGGRSYGLYAIASDSSSTGDVAVRNNVIDAGSSGGSPSAGIALGAAYPSGGPRFLILANSVSGPSLVTPLAQTGALTLESSARSVIYDNVLLARTNNGAALVALTTGLRPLSLYANALFADASNHGLCYDIGNLDSATDANGIDAFCSSGGSNLALTTSWPFQGSSPSGAPSFFGLTFAGAASLPTPDQAFATGGIDLSSSAASTLIGPVAPWYFNVDLNGNARTGSGGTGWSMGAVEN